MPYLARGQENNQRILALHAVDWTGHLYDPDLVEFRVIDLSTGLQVFPVAGYEDVTDEGRVSKGVYKAFDTVLDVGWTPEVTATIGAHRIDWRFTSSDGLSTRAWSLEFDVYEEDTGLPFWTYLTPNQVRAEGIATAELDDVRLVALILRIQQHIERETRQPFRPVAITDLGLDGSGSALLPLSVPIIGVDSLRINHSTQDLDPSAYRVYFAPSLGDDPGWQPKDYRRNPKIVLAAEFTPSPFNTGGVFGSNLNAGRFQPGAKPTTLAGVFGFVEPDGTTPLLIRQAALMLALANTPLLEAGAGGGGGPGGPVVRERTDRHEVEYAKPPASATLSSSFNTSPEVEDILRRYKGPIGMASPTTRWDTVRS